MIPNIINHLLTMSEDAKEDVLAVSGYLFVIAMMVFLFLIAVPVLERVVGG